MAKKTSRPTPKTTRTETLKSWILARRNLKAWNGLVPLAIFLVLTVPSGLFLTFNVPAFWAADGAAHIERVFQIADGGYRPIFIDHNHGVGYGGKVPTTVTALREVEIGIVSRSPAPPGQITLKKIITPQDKQDIAKISSQKISKDRQLVSYVNTAAYSPLAYAPSVAGIKMGMALNLNLGHTLLLARLFSFVVFLLCVGYSLYALRKSQFKWMVMTVALLPLVTFQATLITADSFLLSLAILFSALILKGLQGGQNLSLADKTLLYLSVVLIPITKPTYFPLVFLVLILPRQQWDSYKKYWIWTGSALGISMIGFVVWSLLTTDVAASNGLVRGDLFWNYGDADVQKKFMMHHPFGYIHVLFDSMLYVSKIYAENFFGWLGFTYLPIPGLALVAGYLSLGLSVLVAGKAKLAKYSSLAVLGSVAATALLIFTTLYAYYTVPRNSVVEGVQGRYFLPVTVLLLAGLAMALPKLRVANDGINNAKVLLIVLISSCFLLSILRYGLAITT